MEMALVYEHFRGCRKGFPAPEGPLLLSEENLAFVQKQGLGLCKLNVL
jgi:hypothetical protein